MKNHLESFSAPRRGWRLLGLPAPGVLALGVLALGVLTVLLAGACGRQAGGQQEVVVFAAASLRDALGELATPFERETATAAVFNFAGSNVLARQIEAAPHVADVYLSADEHWLDYLAERGLLLPDSRRVLLSNRLVVVAPPGSTLELSRPEDLATADFRLLSLGDPVAVPAGIYARNFLGRVVVDGTSLWQRLESRVAPAPDVRAALAVVEAQPDVLGIVYRSDAVAVPRVRVVLEVPADLTPKIVYSAAVIAASAHRAAAQRFLDFLARPEAAAVFERAGFVVPGRAAAQESP